MSLEKIILDNKILLKKLSSEEMNLLQQHIRAEDYTAAKKQLLEKIFTSMNTDEKIEFLENQNRQLDSILNSITAIDNIINVLIKDVGFKILKKILL